MNYLLTFIILAACFLGMAVGVIFAKKALRKGCSLDPENPNSSCTCQRKEDNCQLHQPDELKK
ncbi:hypothetical protein KAR91_61435 [Candidatus Pacearchaeota archaeon]|nr:hypothetical protein [Candidatus Pacearchaeota archaeon]